MRYPYLGANLGGFDLNPHKTLAEVKIKEFLQKIVAETPRQ